jgi:hypothetical protein
MTTVSNLQGANPGSSVAMSRRWMIVYWISTLYIVFESLVAGVTDILQLPLSARLLLHLGYPASFGVLLGVWKVLGSIVLLAPRYPLLKEWAYAGMFFDFSAAIVAHSAVGDGVVWLVGPIMSIGALAASWALRPPSRRLALTT